GSGPAPTTAGRRQKPSPQLVQQRLKLLRSYRWSSYPMPVTPKRPAVLRGGAFLWRRQARAPRQEYRRYVQQAVCEGYVQRPWEGLVGQAVLGSRNFIEELTERVRGIRAEASAGAVSVAARR